MNSITKVYDLVFVQDLSAGLFLLENKQDLMKVREHLRTRGPQHTHTHTHTVEMEDECLEFNEWMY